MKILGLTGGIASGKSTVAQYIQDELHVPVIDCDLIARQVVQPGRAAYRKIVKEFGPGVLKSSNGQMQPEIDRDKLGAIVFADPQARRRLNACTHPAIRMEIAKEVGWHWLKGRRMIIVDAPLLYESGLDRFFNPVLVVACSEEKQLERLRKRNPELSELHVRQRIAAQMDLKEKCRRAQHVIDNNGSLSKTKAQVEKVIRFEQPGFFEAYGPTLLAIGVLYAIYRYILG